MRRNLLGPGRGGGTSTSIQEEEEDARKGEDRRLGLGRCNHETKHIQQSVLLNDKGIFSQQIYILAFFEGHRRRRNEIFFLNLQFLLSLP